jgi:hypothetical protein
MEVGNYLSASQKKRKQRRRYIVVVLSVVAAIAVFSGVFWFVFKSPIFKIQNVVVSGNASVASDDIVSLVHSVILENHNPIKSFLGIGNMLAWPHALSPDKIAAIPELARVAIKKDYMTRTIAITVEERKPFAVWCFMPKGEVVDTSDNGVTGTVTTEEADEECYWFDDSGIMFGKGFDSEGSIVMAVHDYSQSPASLGATILPFRFVPALVSIVNVLRASGLNVKEVRLNDIGLQEIKATTYDGPDVLFSLRFPADYDLSVIKSIMAKPGFKNLQYLDFRTEDRAYYE